VSVPGKGGDERNGKKMTKWNNRDNDMKKRRSKWRTEKRKTSREGDMHYFCKFVRIDM